MVFNKPPKLVTNVPRFLFERTMTSFIKKFIQWSVAEYLSAIDYYRSNGNERGAKAIERRYKASDVVANREEFKKIIGLMTANIWNSLSRREREILYEAYQITSRAQRVQA